MEEAPAANPAMGTPQDAEGGGIRVAVTPFPLPETPLWMLDAAGNLFGGRKRSYSDDYAAAVRALVATEAPSVEESNDADAAAATVAPPAAADDTSEKEEEDTEDADRHPLFPVITSLREAMGEANQLVNLIDLATTGEFVRLERVAEPLPEPGPDPIIAAAAAQSRSLSAAARSLAARAERIRGGVAEQRRFQNELAGLRSRWRIIAPAHGKVSMPIRVGEPLAVDCSYTSAGGGGAGSGAAASNVDFDAASGGGGSVASRKIELHSGAGGAVEGIAAAVGEALMTLEVSVACARSGIVQRVTASAGGASSGATGSSGSMVDGISSGGSSSGHLSGFAGYPRLPVEDRLEHALHSSFCEELLAAVRTEALATCPQWTGTDVAALLAAAAAAADRPAATSKTEAAAAATAAAGRPTATSMSAAEAVAASGWWSQQHPLSAVGAAAAGPAAVVHVLDDEVCVQISDRHILTLKLVMPAAAGAGSAASAATKPGVATGAMEIAGEEAGVEGPATHFADGNGATTTAAAKPPTAAATPIAATAAAAAMEAELLSLCRLALLHGSFLVREGQRLRAAAAAAATAAATAAAAAAAAEQAKLPRALAARTAKPPVDVAAAAAAAASAATVPPVLASIVALLRHVVLRAEVCRAVSAVSAAVTRPLGVAVTAIWSTVELQQPESRLALTLGGRIGGGGGGLRLQVHISATAATVEAAPGLAGPAAYRRIELHDASEFRWWLLSEICRQTALACGDICAATQERLPAWPETLPTGLGATAAVTENATLQYTVSTCAGDGGEIAGQRAGTAEVAGFVLSIQPAAAPAAANYGATTAMPPPDHREASMLAEARCVVMGNSFAGALRSRGAAVEAGPAAEGKEAAYLVTWDSLPEKDVFSRFEGLLEILVALPLAPESDMA